MLLVGTNTFAILTQNITEWVNFVDPRDMMDIIPADNYGADYDDDFGETDPLKQIMMQ